MTKISIPSQQKIDIIEKDEMFTIRKCDWKRIKRLVNNIPKPSQSLSITYSILFGIGGTTLLTLIPLKNLSDLDGWVIPLYTIVTISSVLMAIILLLIEKKVLKEENKSVKDINVEFSEIDGLCGPPQKE